MERQIGMPSQFQSHATIPEKRTCGLRYASVIGRAIMVAPLSFLPVGALAGEVEIVGATARAIGPVWTISVTLRHDDTGWDHYADLWQVRLADGTLLGERKLAHPHVDEQPFTRSLAGIVIPPTANSVFIRARDTMHGFSSDVFELELSD